MEVAKPYYNQTLRFTLCLADARKYQAQRYLRNGNKVLGNSVFFFAETCRSFVSQLY